MVNGVASAEGAARYSGGHEIPLASGAIDGIFARWEWNGEHLTARNDRYGVKPLFYCERDNTLILSPSLLQLLAEGAPTELDDRAMAVFLRLGFFLGDDTPFKHIRAVPPNAALMWKAGRLEIAGGRPIIKAQPISRDSAIDAYIELFRKAMERRPPTSEQCAAPLSGGRDSRHILLELVRSDRKPSTAVTVRRYRPVPGDDLSTAQRLAAALDVPHLAVRPTHSFTSYETRKNILTHLCTDEMWWVLPVIDALAGRINCVWDGLGGDVLSAGLFLSEDDHRLCEQDRLDEIAQRMFRTWSGTDAAVEGVLPKAERGRFTMQAALDRAIEELRTHQDAASPITSFYFWNRTRREVALSPAALYDAVGCAYVPFLDHDLFDFLSSLPVELMWDQSLHTATIHKGYPEFAHVPFENRGNNRLGLAAAPLQAVRSTLEMLRFARRFEPGYGSIIRSWTWNKLRRKPSGGMPRRMAHYAMQLHAAGSQEGARAQLESIQ